jgi:WD repeat-containing protein 23
VLVGHTEGITSVSAKGDGRYVISNGKDQALRLWDLRNMRSSTEFDQFSRKTYRDDEFDYRYGTPPRLRRPAHPADCSVMTYRGHTVLQTLIRCWFSPMETTGARYIYSGSADGRIHVRFEYDRMYKQRLTCVMTDLVSRRPHRAGTRSIRDSPNGV